MSAAYIIVLLAVFFNIWLTLIYFDEWKLL